MANGNGFGSFFSNVLSGVGSLIQQATPLALDVGQQFLQRELQRKQISDQKKLLQAAAVQVGNTPGISVSTLGGTLQPVGGRVQRSTFTPAALTPAQQPFGNIPLLPVRSGNPPFVGNDIRANPVIRNLMFPGTPAGSTSAMRTNMANGNGRLPMVAGAPGEPKFALDERGNTIKFVPSPRPGEGFIRLEQARALGLNPTKPFWRFNRLMGQFEKMKSRRMNPFNFRAAERAGRRIDRTLDAVGSLLSIQKKKDTGKSCGGKVVKFRTKKKKRC